MCIYNNINVMKTLENPLQQRIWIILKCMYLLEIVLKLNENVFFTKAIYNKVFCIISAVIEKVLTTTLLCCNIRTDSDTTVNFIKNFCFQYYYSSQSLASHHFVTVMVTFQIFSLSITLEKRREFKEN